MKFLCVDDTKSVHAFMRSIFAGTSHILVDVFDGQQAIDELSKHKFKGFDAVMLDWEMPVKTGLETLIEIRKNSSDLPILMVTSKNDIMDIARLLDAGASEYIMKPFTKDILFEKLALILGREVE